MLLSISLLISLSLSLTDGTAGPRVRAQDRIQETLRYTEDIVSGPILDITVILTDGRKVVFRANSSLAVDLFDDDHFVIYAGCYRIRDPATGRWTWIVLGLHPVSIHETQRLTFSAKGFSYQMWVGERDGSGWRVDVEPDLSPRREVSSP